MALPVYWTTTSHTVRPVKCCKCEGTVTQWYRYEGKNYCDHCVPGPKAPR